MNSIKKVFESLRKVSAVKAAATLGGKWRWAQAVVVLLAVVVCVPLARGQKDTGAIVGVVKDSSGGVVGKATITATDTERGERLTAASDDQGNYVLTPLRVGKYRVTVEKPGFKTAAAGPFTVNVQDRLEIDITLQPGEVTEHVEVIAQAVELQTETSDLGQVVDSRRIVTLPLNGRNYAQLAQLGAGVAPSEPGSRVSSTFGFSANGARALQNNFLLDGVDNNANLGDVLNESAYVIQPSVDAIEEFKVQTNSYSSEFGRGNGAILNAVIKSGTNAFHGDVYEFIRNDAFDGANSTLKSQGFGREPYKQNQFGATLGGPLLKNRTFFFVDYEGLRIHQGIILNGTIPTQSMVAGDFSSFLTNTPAAAADLNGNPLAQTALDCNGNPTFVGELFNARLTLARANNPLYPNGFCGVPIAGPGGQINVFGGNTPIRRSIRLRLGWLLCTPHPTPTTTAITTSPFRWSKPPATISTCAWTTDSPTRIPPSIVSVTKTSHAPYRRPLEMRSMGAASLAGTRKIPTAAWPSAKRTHSVLRLSTNSASATTASIPIVSS